MLTSRQLSQLRLFIGGKEQALYVAALHGTHADGSLRSVLVRFNYPLSFETPVAGQLLVGQDRETDDIPRPDASLATPAAVMLPADPNYLVSTELVGPTITVASAAQLSPTFQKYEADFQEYADHHWNQNGSTWTESYYDRALI
jgi:hypothetical protein